MHKVSRYCWLTNKIETMVLPVTQGEVDAWLSSDDAPFVWDAFPALSLGECEFVLTGLTPGSVVRMVWC